MHYELRRVAVWSLVRIAFVLYGLVGLAVGAFAGLVGLLAGVAGEAVGNDFPLTGVLPLGMSVLLLPVIAFGYAVVGGVGVGVAGVVYNLLAGWVGGIEVSLDPRDAVSVGPGNGIAGTSVREEGPRP